MKQGIWIVLAAVLFGAAGFWGGVTYQKTQSPSGAGFAGRFGPPGANGANGSRNAANVTTGTVIAQDASSITVKTANGGSKTVFVSGSTDVSKQEVLKVTDIKVGDQVGAFGDAANGGINARMLQIVPPGGSFRFGGAGGPRGGGSGGSSSTQGGGAPSGQ
jgi:hypothetical protein